MRVLLATCGSRGDVQPMFAFAKALREHGHEVLLAASPNFADEAEVHDVKFVAMGQNIEVFVKKLGDKMFTRRLAFMGELRDFLAEEVRAQFACLIPLASSFDVVVGAALVLAGPSVRDAKKVPYRHIAFAPEAVPAADVMPLLFPWQNMPNIVNRLAWRATDLLFRSLFLGPINVGRQAFDLAPLRKFFPNFVPMEEIIFAVDPEIVPLSKDYEGAPPATGAWHLADSRPLDPKLEQFLKSGEPPIYLGFGSMPSSDPKKTSEILFDAVRRVGCRAILSAGWAGLGREDVPPNVFVVQSSNHGQLFPRVSVVVHHGGAGTTAAATRAGIPQVVVPHAFDQFAWGERVANANIGPRPIDKNDLGVDVLAQRLTQCLTGSEIRTRAAEIGRSVRARNSLELAIRTLASR